MTDPLITKDRLLGLLYDALRPPLVNHPADVSADVVMEYLHSVLTPEALDTHGTRTRDSSGRWIYRVRMPTGDGLHRRIFGEDK